MSQVSVCKSFLRPTICLCKRVLSDSESCLVWGTAEMSWVEISRRWDRLISARMRWKQLRRTYLNDMWEEMGWGEKSSHDLRWDEVWSVKCQVWSEVRGVKSGVWNLKKRPAWGCIATWSRAGHVLGQQQCNSFAQSTHARAWLVHGACKFYRWERSYSTTLRQFPPRLMRVLVNQL